MPIGEICTREVVIVEKGASIQEAAQLMRRHHVGNLVVVAYEGTARIPVGILTDRDIVIEIVAAGVDLEKVTVGDVMSFDLATVREQDGIWDSLQYMRSKGVRRMPVVDQGGALIGIISADDLLDLLAEELGAVAALIKREQFKEARARK